MRKALLAALRERLPTSAGETCLSVTLVRRAIAVIGEERMPMEETSQFFCTESASRDKDSIGALLVVGARRLAI
jgi:hypothetical protein